MGSSIENEVASLYEQADKVAASGGTDKLSALTAQFCGIVSERFGAQSAAAADAAMASGDVCRRHKLFSDAKRHFTNAVALYSELDRNGLNLAYALTAVSGVYKDSGDTAKAVDTLKLAKSLLERNGGDMLELASTLNALAQFETLNPGIVGESAGELLSKALDIYRAELGEHDQLYATALNSYGLYLHSAGDNDGALSAFRKVERIMLDAYGEGSQYHRMAVETIRYLDNV